MTVRVILIDDSAIARAKLEEVVEQAPDLRVVRKLAGLRDVDIEREMSSADVVLVDMLMPGRSGLGALDDLVAAKPVLVVSDSEAGSSIASEALARGVRGYVSKKELATEAGRERLRTLIRRAADGRVSPSGRAPLLVIVGSTGAHRALEQLVPALAGVQVRAVVLQHMPEGGEAGFVSWLTRLGVPARLVGRGHVLEAGQLAVAAAGRHLEIERSGRVRLRPAEPGDLHVPSADVLLRSLVPSATSVTVVVLSGLGRDAAGAVGELEAAGARVLVQAPDEAVAPSMPEAALAATERARALPLPLLAHELSRAARR